MNKVYSIITEKIVQLLEKGVVPWQRPWVGGHSPTSLTTGKPYKGVNTVWLNCVAIDEGWEDNFWITWKQIKAQGGSVLEDEKKRSHIVVYWRWFKKTDDDGEETGKKFATPFYYRVWNVAQCEGIEFEAPVLPDTYSPIDAADAIIDGYPHPPKILHETINRAYYSPLYDRVHLPMTEQFISTEEYYAVAFHELIHSTGHQTRLNRGFGDSFGSDPYAKEELVAELGAAMLCGIVGIDPAIIDNSASYIANWIARFKDDKRLLMSASGKASKAANHMRNIVWEEVAKPKPPVIVIPTTTVGSTPKPQPVPVTAGGGQISFF